MSNEEEDRMTKQTENHNQGPLTAEQKRIMRRRKARKRALGRLVALVLFVAVLVVVWQNWDVLAPDRLMSEFEMLVGSGTGEYPVDMSGVSVRRLEKAEQYGMVLTESHLIYLNHGGAEVARYSCSYPTPLMKTAGKYVLVAEQGGRRLQLSTRSAVVLELETKRDIIAVALNEKGKLAVLTDGPQGYAVEISVYNRKGELVYTRDRNVVVTDVALSANGKQVAMLSPEAVNGTLNTRMDVFSVKTTDTEAVCSYVAKDALLYRLEYLQNGWVAGFGENGAVMLDTTDGLATVYAPEGVKVLGYATTGNHLALAVRPYGTTAGGEIHVVGKDGDPMTTVVFTGELRHLSGQNGAYALLTDSYVQKIAKNGADGMADMAADGQQVILDGNSAIVLGLNRIDSYALN